MKKGYLLSIVFSPLLVASCASAPVGTPGVGDGSEYTPVIDGVMDEKYYRDLRECRDIAHTVQSQKESEVAQSMLAGALVGAAIGSIDDGEAATDGAIFGSILGGVDSQSEASSSGKIIVTNCMSGRGYNVLL